jgi:hypothetical protein
MCLLGVNRTLFVGHVPSLVLCVFPSPLHCSDKFSYFFGGGFNFYKYLDNTFHKMSNWSDYN